MYKHGVAIIANTKDEARYWLRKIVESNTDGKPIALGAYKVEYENIYYQAFNKHISGYGYKFDQVFRCGSPHIVDDGIIASILIGSCVPEEYRVQWLNID